MRLGCDAPSYADLVTVLLESVNFKSCLKDYYDNPTHKYENQSQGKSAAILSAPCSSIELVHPNIL